MYRVSVKHVTDFIYLYREIQTMFLSLFTGGHLATCLVLFLKIFVYIKTKLEILCHNRVK